MEPISALLNLGEKLISRFIPDPQQKADALLKLKDMEQKGELAQLAAETDLAKGQQEINKIEAASSNLFVSGARPFIMWVCGFALAYHFILQPLLAFFLSSIGHKVDLPIFDMSALNTILMGLLGLGSMRSFEKVKGVTK